MANMDPNIIIAEIDECSRVSGLKPSTICQFATGNARLYDRLKKRAEKDQAILNALRQWMSQRDDDRDSGPAGSLDPESMC